MNILIFGGNGFIGGATVARLISEGNHKLVLTSRGTWKWDNKERIKPFVTHISCDRYKPDDAIHLKQLIYKTKFDAVIDFSAYKRRAVVPFYNWLVDANGKDGFDRIEQMVYIYISSDSVYEVCCVSQTGISHESDSVRPESKEEQEKLKKKDKYGHHKFGVEEFLTNQRVQNCGIPYVFLRLPDVLGERDDMDGEGRLTEYEMLIKFKHILGNVPIPSSLRTLKTSYVYVNDVASAVSSVLKSGIKDDVFNVALEEPKSLQELITSLAREMNMPVEFILDSDKKDGPSFELLPSVTRGPVSIDKILTDQRIQWLPSDWSTVLANTVKFNENAYSQFPVEIKNCANDLLKIFGSDVTGEQRKRLLGEVKRLPSQNDGSYIVPTFM